MSGDPVLGAPVHLLGPDLDLEGLHAGPDHGGVQGLVEVELRRVDVILEPALNRWPQSVHCAERRPAVLLGGHDHADRHQVVDLVEFLAPHNHLLVDAPEVLRAPGDLRIDPGLTESGTHDREHLGELDLTPWSARGDHLRDLGEALGVKSLEREVLQLPFHFLNTQAMRKGGIDVPGLLGSAALLPLGHHRQRPHVVEPVRQLDDQHPPVAGHRDEHLAHRGGLLRLFRVETKPVQLRDPIHDRRHRRTEFLPDLGEGHPGVLHRVVQQRRGRAYGVQAEIGDDRGNRDRMGDVRLARQPVLTFVGFDGQGVRPPHQIEILAAAASAQSREDAFDLRGWRRDEGPGGVLGGRLTELGSRPGQHGIDHGHDLNLPAESDWTSVFAPSRRSLGLALQLNSQLTAVTNPKTESTPAERAAP